MNNKIPCGGFYLSDTLGVDENGKLGVNGGEPYKSLVTDGDGNVKWEDRLAYEVTGWKDFTLNGDIVNSIKITGFTMPPVGNTVTVKVNGVESVETVKLGESRGQSYSYIGSTDLNGLLSGTYGWLVANANAEVIGVANPETTVSFLITEQHKIDEKYQDTNFVRPLSYYVDGARKILKTYYKEDGEGVVAIKYDNIKLPRIGEVIIYDLGENMGIGKTFSITETNNAFLIGVNIFEVNVNYQSFIFGTDETEITEFAAEEGYTLTTKPTT